MAGKCQAYIVLNLSYNHEAEQPNIAWSDVKQFVTFSPPLQPFQVSSHKNESTTPI